MATRITDIYHEPEHWNRNCGCMIPEAWVAIIEVDGERQPKLMAATTADLIDAVKREWGQDVHTLVNA